MSGERILVVEDDRAIAKNIGEYLGSEGFQVTLAHDGPGGLSMWQELSPDLVVLDWMLPGLSGLDLCRRIRQAGRTPVVMLTARSDEADKLLGLELGADDYLTKPFSLRELTARVRAVLRRSRPDETGAADEPLRFGPLSIDLTGHNLWLAGEPVAVTPTEFKLLATLARSPGRVFTRLQLMEAALGEYYEGYERTLDSHISRLRHKLGGELGARLVQTVHGVGYKLVPPGR